MDAALVVCAAILLDAALGEPRRWHPLVGFGRLAGAIERRLYHDSVAAGLLALMLLALPLTLAAMTLYLLPAAVQMLSGGILLYLAIGWRSLDQHAAQVQQALAADDLPLARHSVGMMVSRDTAALDSGSIAGATIESVLENGNDAIFAAIFWFMIAGPPGVVLYRVSNTLDAMWGYRNARYLRFGRTAARLDDLMNMIPARLTALSYALLGRTRSALRCWRRQAGQWKSPNAGPVMAAGAASLGVELGGAAIYQGVSESRPVLGAGHSPVAADIGRARQLVGRTVMLWVIILLVGGWFAT